MQSWTSPRMNWIGLSRISHPEKTRSAGILSSDASVMLGHAPLLACPMSWVASIIIPITNRIPATIAVLRLRYRQLGAAGREFQLGIKQKSWTQWIVGTVARRFTPSPRRGEGGVRG